MKINIISFFLLLALILTSCSSNVQKNKKEDTLMDESTNFTQELKEEQKILEEDEESITDDKPAEIQAAEEQVKDSEHSISQAGAKSAPAKKAIENSQRNSNQSKPPELKATSENLDEAVAVIPNQENVEKKEAVNESIQPDENKEEAKVAVEDKKQSSVTISIIGANEHIILDKTYVDYKEGQTVYDILETVAKNNNIEIKTRGSKSFLYIVSIDGLAEFDQGPLSGWKYMVNGEEIKKSSGVYQLKENDEIIWKYSIEL